MSGTRPRVFLDAAMLAQQLGGYVSVRYAGRMLLDPDPLDAWEDEPEAACFCVIENVTVERDERGRLTWEEYGGFGPDACAAVRVWVNGETITLAEARRRVAAPQHVAEIGSVPARSVEAVTEDLAQDRFPMFKRTP